jgi:hypothetical protein
LGRTFPSFKDFLELEASEKIEKLIKLALMLDSGLHLHSEQLDPVITSFKESNAFSPELQVQLNHEPTHYVRFLETGLIKWLNDMKLLLSGAPSPL